MTAHDAAVHAIVVAIPVFAGERPFGALLLGHVELLGRKAGFEIVWHKEKIAGCCLLLTACREQQMSWLLLTAYCVLRAANELVAAYCVLRAANELGAAFLYACCKQHAVSSKQPRFLFHGSRRP
jgi:hypothetical protein